MLALTEEVFQIKDETFKQRTHPEELTHLFLIFSTWIIEKASGQVEIYFDLGPFQIISPSELNNTLQTETPNRSTALIVQIGY